MCGRYALYGPRPRLRERFALASDFDWQPRFNIAPSQPCPVIRADAQGERRLELAHWGLVPSWARPDARISRPINAKAETAAEKPMFRRAFRRSRVLVPASAFYEWQVAPSGKQPWLIHPADDGYFALAGLLEHWNGPQGELASFAILTTAANAAMRPIHDRMPAIIAESDWSRWLDPRLDDVPRLAAMLAATQGTPLAMHRVGRAVGNPANEGPGLIEPLPD